MAKYCPVPVLPDDCAINWIEQNVYPSCVGDFLDSVQKQQETIIDNCEPL